MTMSTLFDPILTAPAQGLGAHRRCYVGDRHSIRLGSRVHTVTVLGNVYILCGQFACWRFDLFSFSNSFAMLFEGLKILHPGGILIRDLLVRRRT
jgi:hypothetical protein